MSKASCNHSPDQFCYICGKYIKARKEKRSLGTDLVLQEAYKAYFGLDIANQDQDWVPHFSCMTCRFVLLEWIKGEDRSFKFIFPRLWLQPTDHSTNCYFCLVDVLKHHEESIPIMDIPSSRAPIFRTAQHILPVPPGLKRDEPTSSTTCRFSPDQFCYVCGIFLTRSAEKRLIDLNDLASKSYKAYFGINIINQDKPWAPHYMCDKCRRNLTGWFAGENRTVSLTMPKLWFQTVHSDSCYFCRTANASGRINVTSDVNLNASTSSAPSLNPVEPQIESGSYSTITHDSSTTMICSTDSENKAPHFINKQDLSDLTRDLGLSKEKAQILASRLKEWNLLKEDVNITDIRSRHKPFLKFFTTRNDIVYCCDINGLFKALDIEHIPEEWRLFIDGSSKSLKAVLLNNGNKLSSIPLAYTTKLKETYESTSLILRLIRYENHLWEVIGDFKMVTFLMGLQGGFTKYCCFLCLWNSRDISNHFVRRNWPNREKYQVGKDNIKYVPLVDRNKVLMPPLHIKLGLAKQFIKALDKECEAFRYLRELFPAISEAKLKEGILVGPQIKKIIENERFQELLPSKNEKDAWQSFVLVTRNFLGNNRTANYRELVETMIEHFRKMGCKMSLKLHVLHSHLDRFKDNNGAYSEEHGERFHQDLNEFEQRYHGKNYESMLADFMWSTKYDLPNVEHHRRVSYKS